MVTSRSVGLPVFVVRNVLGELGAQCQFLPLLLPIVRHPRYLLGLLRALDRLYLWHGERRKEMGVRDGLWMKGKDKEASRKREKETRLAAVNGILLSSWQVTTIQTATRDRFTSREY